MFVVQLGNCGDYSSVFQKFGTAQATARPPGWTAVFDLVVSDAFERSEDFHRFLLANLI